MASTSGGSLFRLTLTSSGGKRHLTSRLFARPTSHLSLSRLLPSIFSSANSGAVSTIPLGHSKNINAIAFGATTSVGGKEVWALVDTRLQKWDMKPEGWEEMLVEGDVLSILAAAIRKTFGARVNDDDKMVDLELLDLAVDEYAIPSDLDSQALIPYSDKLVILLSYAGVEEESKMTLDAPVVRRIYALAHLSYWNDTFKVLTIRSVPYQSVSDPLSFVWRSQNLLFSKASMPVPRCTPVYNLLWMVP